jgi:DNA-binding HxlR family transcriptional regulator
MKGKRTNLRATPAPSRRSLYAIGDRWSLLIVRDALTRTQRFGAFQKQLGIAKNILTMRLRKLVAEGIMEPTTASD